MYQEILLKIYSFNQTIEPTMVHLVNTTIEDNIIQQSSQKKQLKGLEKNIVECLI